MYMYNNLNNEMQGQDEEPEKGRGLPRRLPPVVNRRERGSLRGPGRRQNSELSNNNNNNST